MSALEQSEAAESAYRLGGNEGLVRFVAGLPEGAVVRCPCCRPHELCLPCSDIPRAVQHVEDRAWRADPHRLHQEVCARAVALGVPFRFRELVRWLAARGLPKTAPGWPVAGSPSSHDPEPKAPPENAKTTPSRRGKGCQP